MSGSDPRPPDNRPPDTKKPSHLAERAAQMLGSVGDLSLPPAPVQRAAEAATPPVQRMPAEVAASIGEALVGEALVGEAAISEPAVLDLRQPVPPIVPAALGAPALVSRTARSTASSQASEEWPATIGTVSLETLAAAGLVVSGNVRTRISEEYRIAVSRILRAARAKRPGATAGELLMVTSARPGEGKSFTALNLAGAIAHNVMRPTVLVDVDFKKRSITHHLGLSDRMGLLDVAASGSLRIEDLVVPTAVEHLSILPVGRDAGDIVDAPGSLLARRPVSQVIERLARRFPEHIFILDLPPCLSTSDPSTLAPVVNEVIMVVEAERTQRNEVEAALDLIKLCPKITLLLNKIRTTSSNTFGAYDYYGSYS